MDARAVIPPEAVAVFERAIAINRMKDIERRFCVSLHKLADGKALGVFRHPVHGALTVPLVDPVQTCALLEKWVESWP